MKNNNTILGLDLFDINLSDTFVLHIPHASINIPMFDHYIKGKLDNEIIKLTDWATDEIFNIKNVSKVVANFSRIFCDVERFADDELEPMSKFGRGFYYTKTDSGENLREDNEDYKKHIYDNYYLPHHNELNSIVEDKLLLFDTCTIIDCHSFSDVPFDSDLIKDDNRPDICIGTDDYHTPQLLVEWVSDYFKMLGYSVQINNPYSGTIVNNNSYQKDKRVKSIMIEINRKLYMEDHNIIDSKVELLNKQITDLLYKY